MTVKNGKPCKKCGASAWYDCGVCKECSRRRKKANRSRVLEEKRKYRENNKTKISEADKKYRQENKERVAAWNLKWAQDNPDKVRAKKQKRKTKVTKAGGSFTAEEWRQLCNQYDNHCLRCGHKKKLTADHVIPVSMGGSSDISNIQPLCQSCNSRKGATVKDYRTKGMIERWISISIFDVLSR